MPFGGYRGANLVSKNKSFVV